MGRHPRRRARRQPETLCRSAGTTHPRADDARRARSRQNPSQRHRRSARSRRFLPLLRPRSRAHPCQPRQRQRRDDCHQSVELPARHLHRRNHRRAGSRQHRGRQARRTNQPNRALRRATDASSRHPRHRLAARAGRGRRGRSAHPRPTHRRRDFHRLNRSCPAHQPHPCPARRLPRADCRNRRAKRHDCGQYRPARASGRRCHQLRL